MRRDKGVTGFPGKGGGLAALALIAALALPAEAQLRPGKIDPDGYNSLDQIRAALPEYFEPSGALRARPADIPDVFGPGAVLRVGNVYMKVTNFGHCGNFFTNLSSDPAGQWPGASGVEYLSTIRLAVAGVNPQATDPAAIRRVSYLFEWRPPTLDKVDHIYQSYDGILNGTRNVNDDRDVTIKGVPKIDEDFLDGRDNDGDNAIDEDYGALGQQEYTCLMRDDTREAINSTFNEKHVPLGLECRQAAWAYSIPGFSDFDVIEYTIFNRSGHTIDSLCVGWLVDMDAGPVSNATFFRDDFDLPGFPSGEFTQLTTLNDKRLQDSTMRGDDFTNPRDVSADSALCPRFTLRINGFSIADDNDDDGLTKGIPSFLLINHTVDPLGLNGPARVQFNAYRSFTAGTPYIQGGNPIVDQQRFEFMVGTPPNNIDPVTGFINQPPGDQKGDYVSWCSVGPYRNVVDGASVQATVAFAVRPGEYAAMLNYFSDYARYQAGNLPWATLRESYPSLDNALAIQVAYEGIWQDRPDLSGHPDWPFLPNGHGRETPLIAAPGTGSFEARPDCRDLSTRTVTELSYDWFDYDCSYCTGAYDSRAKRGMFHSTWNVGAPPPNPNVNVASSSNYSDNPDTSRVVPAGDSMVKLAWDNLSEVTADPKTGVFDFRGYKVWKAANWTRPVGSAGPSDDDWSLFGEYRFFDYLDLNHANPSAPSGQDTIWIRTNYDSLKYATLEAANPGTGKLACPLVYVPNRFDPATNRYVGPDTVRICLQRGDLWDRQTGIIIRPDTNVVCVGGKGTCKTDRGCILGQLVCSDPRAQEVRDHFPIGRYKLVDHDVKNGFIYFYSITAFDSTGGGAPELGGRKSAVEAEGVVPQFSAAKANGRIWVVPNPYRGFANLNQRPSAWDLTPNATDPTGTHIDFFGLPSGRWTIRIYTVSGDLVQTIKSDDPVNESVRGPVVGNNGKTYDGANRQQDNPDDGQARWNLISRNGQDIVSGIYLFTVESTKGTQRGRFVVIR
jgi:hypothetical protein